MKQIGSVITTSPRERHSGIGTQGGERGLATSANSRHVTPDEAAAMMRSLTPFRGMRPATEVEADETLSAIEAMRTPATAKWLNGRIATLLAHYYVANMDPKMMEAVADDWHHALKGFPAWAIANSCRFWLSAANDRHRSKPMPGDIQGLADKEMALIRVAEYWLRVGVAPEAPAQLEKYTPTAEERAEIAKMVFASVYGEGA